MTSNRRSRTSLAVYGIILFASLVRIVICFAHNPLDWLYSDPKRHWENALNILSPDFIGAGDPIVYQIYLRAIQLLTGGNRLLIAGACAILSILMPWFYYRAARSLGLDRRYSSYAWALIAVTPSLISIYHYFMIETVLLVLIGAALWATGRYLGKGTATALVAASVLWTLCALTKPTAIPLAAVCMAWALLRRGPTWREFAIAALLSICLLIPNALRTQYYLGFMAPFGNAWLTRIQHRSGKEIIQIESGKAKWTFLSPSCFMQPFEPLSSWMMKRSGTDTRVDVVVDLTAGARDWRKTFESLHVGWRETFSQWVENVPLFLFASSWPDSNVHDLDGRLNYLTRWIWAPLIFGLLAWNGREFFSLRFDLIPVATTCFILFLLFQNVVTMEGRYRKPLEPLLLLNLAWAFAPRPRVANQSARPRSEI